MVCEMRIPFIVISKIRGPKFKLRTSLLVRLGRIAWLVWRGVLSVVG